MNNNAKEEMPKMILRLISLMLKTHATIFRDSQGAFNRLS